MLEAPIVRVRFLSWSAPPAAFASGRAGFANRRSLATAFRSCLGAATATAWAGAGVTTRCGVRRWEPALAGALGLGSALGSLSSRAICALVTVRCLGVG